jgi:hypothetical protein
VIFFPDFLSSAILNIEAVGIVRFIKGYSTDCKFIH